MSSLKAIRDSKGLTLEAATALLRDIEPTFPSTLMGLHHIETRGTRNVDYLTAMSKLYDIPLDTLRDIARLNKINQDGEKTLATNSP